MKFKNEFRIIRGTSDEFEKELGLIADQGFTLMGPTLVTRVTENGHSIYHQLLYRAVEVKDGK